MLFLNKPEKVIQKKASIQKKGYTESLTFVSRDTLLRITLYGDCKFKDDVNKRILIATIQFIKNSNRFNQSLI